MEQFDAAVDRPVKGLLLGANDLFDGCLFRAKLRKRVAHGGDQDVNQLKEKRLMESQRTAIANGAPQDAPQDVATIGMSGEDAIGDCERKRPDVVGQNAKRNVDPLLLVLAGRAGRRQRGAVTPSTEPLEPIEQRAEKIALVIGNGSAEIREMLRALQNAAHPLEAHARVHMPGRQRGEVPILAGVELDEDEIPNLHAIGAALVHQRPAAAALWRQIDVDFRTGSARAGLPHHPKVVLPAATHNVYRRIEPGLRKDSAPEIVRFLVEPGRIAGRLIRGVDCGVEPRRRKAPCLGQQFPSPGDGLFFEIIPEAPVAQHLEKSVVVAVEAHVFEIVVLASGADAFLRVGGAGRMVWAGCSTEKDRHKRIHAGIGEQQVRRIRQQAGRGHNGVPLGSEEIKKRLPDLCGGHEQRRVHNIPNVGGRPPPTWPGSQHWTPRQFPALWPRWSQPKRDRPSS